MNTTEQQLRHAINFSRRHERHRVYAMAQPAKRPLHAIFRACLDTKGDDEVLPIYHAALEKLSDVFSANLLRPAPKLPRKIPEPWRDGHGNVLPNPFATGDAKGQRILRIHDKELAEFYEKAASDPYGFEQSLREEERARVETNALEADYNGAVHEHNVFANPASNETDRTAFAQSFPKHVSIHQRESKPVRALVFGEGVHRTTVLRIYKSDPGLWRVVELAEKHNAELVEAERIAAEREREAAQRKLAELKHKTETLGDGRVITLAR